MIVQFEYKCRRCEQVVDGAATGGNNGMSILTNVITELKPETMLGMVSVHKCVDNGGGMTDLIGYRLTEPRP